jgi:hypothetical protein
VIPKILTSTTTFITYTVPSGQLGRVARQGVSDSRLRWSIYSASRSATSDGFGAKISRLQNEWYRRRAPGGSKHPRPELCRKLHAYGVGKADSILDNGADVKGNTRARSGQSQTVVRTGDLSRANEVLWCSS